MSVPRILFTNGRFISNNITRPVRWNTLSSKKYHHISYLPVRFQDDNRSVLNQSCHVRCYDFPCRKYATHGPEGQSQLEKKPGLFQRFKQMYKDYWYVLVPVHVMTSTVWIGAFYYTVRSGVDIVSVLQSVGVSEKILAPLKDSTAGYFALTYALYKIATPLRYAVTLGGTTYAINRLTLLGWIKPVPSKERIKEIIQEKKDNLQDQLVERHHHYQSQMQEKRSQILDEMRKYRKAVQDTKNKDKK